jgi:hypothetical protein
LPNWLKSTVKQRTVCGDTGDLVLVLGWTSDEMPRLYGASDGHVRVGASGQTRS